MKKKPADKVWSSKYPPAKTVSEFISISPKESQTKLKGIRKIIESALPKTAKEGIYYRMAAYSIDGTYVVAFAGFKKHVGFYPMSGSFLQEFKEELKEYKTSVGAVQFPLDKPLPASLIKKLIKAKLRTF